MSIQIKAQFYFYHGRRPLTYLILVNGIPFGYAKCYCQAVKAAEWLSLTLK